MQKKYLFAMIVFGMVALCFSPTINYKFVSWDDDLLLETNSHYRGFDKENLFWMFTTFEMGHYHPLTWMSYALDYVIWGMDPTGYHLTNVLLHSLNAVLLFFFLLKILGKILPGHEEKGIFFASLLGTCLYAIHPLRAESVAWVTERRDVLSAFFYLATLLSYVSFVEKKQRKESGVFFFCLTCFFLLFSLLSKAWAITLPPILFLLDIFLFKRLETTSISWKRLVWEKIPFCILSLFFAILAFWAQKSVGAMVDMKSLTLIERSIQACYGIFFYISKFFIPYPLSPLYPYTAHSLSDPVAWSCVLAFFLITILFLLSKKFKALFLAWICYILILMPVLGFTQSGPQVVADRYTYISFFPLIVCLSYAIAQIPFHSLKHPALVISTLIMIASLYILLSLQQNAIWENSFTLWSHALRQESKNIVAHYKLAEIYYRKGEINRAIGHAEKCLEINPKHWKAHKSLGEIYLLHNYIEKAIFHFEKAVESKPIPRNFLALAKGYIFRHEKEKAIKVLSFSIEKEPYAPSHYTLATLYLEKKQYKDAIFHYNQCLKLAADDEKQKIAYKYLAMAYYEKKNYPEALKYYKKALQEGIPIEKKWLEKLHSKSLQIK